MKKTVIVLRTDIVTFVLCMTFMLPLTFVMSVLHSCCVIVLCVTFVLSVLSCLVLSCLVLSCLVLSCLVLYWPTVLREPNGQGWVLNDDCVAFNMIVLTYLCRVVCVTSPCLSPVEREPAAVPEGGVRAVGSEAGHRDSPLELPQL